MNADYFWFASLIGDSPRGTASTCRTGTVRATTRTEAFKMVRDLLRNDPDLRNYVITSFDVQPDQLS